MNGANHLHKLSKRRWVAFSLLGGVLGALNPAWYLLRTNYISSIQQRYEFDYTLFAMGSASAFVVILFVPCFISTAILFPWFYSRMSTKKETGKVGFLSLLSSGLLFGCVASILTAFLTWMMISLLNFVEKPDPAEVMISILLSIPATGFITLAGIIISFPAMIITGALFAWLTAKSTTSK